MIPTIGLLQILSVHNAFFQQKVKSIEHPFLQKAMLACLPIPGCDSELLKQVL
jgi:hypothetical protein